MQFASSVVLNFGPKKHAEGANPVEILFPCFFDDDETGTKVTSDPSNELLEDRITFLMECLNGGPEFKDDEWLDFEELVGPAVEYDGEELQLEAGAQPMICVWNYRKLVRHSIFAGMLLQMLVSANNLSCLPGPSWFSAAFVCLMRIHMDLKRCYAGWVHKRIPDLLENNLILMSRICQVRYDFKVICEGGGLDKLVCFSSEVTNEPKEAFNVRCDNGADAEEELKRMTWEAIHRFSPKLAKLPESTLEDLKTQRSEIALGNPVKSRRIDVCG